MEVDDVEELSEQFTEKVYSAGKPRAEIIRDSIMKDHPNIQIKVYVLIDFSIVCPNFQIQPIPNSPLFLSNNMFHFLSTFFPILQYKLWLQFLPTIQSGVECTRQSLGT